MRSLIRSSQLNADVFTAATDAALIAVDTILHPVYQTGNQTITGIKTFITLPQISGGQFVVTTGNQDIGGFKTFISAVTLNSGFATANSMAVFTPNVGAYTIYDLLTDNEIDFKFGTLGNNGNPSLDWMNYILSGDWICQSPINISSVVNRNYVDNGSPNTVKITGDQTIAGNKTFTRSLTLNSGFATANSMLVFSPSSGPYTIYNNLNDNEINFSLGYLGNGGSQNINWINLQLTGGNWSTNTIPTIGTHILNKNYLNNLPNLISGMSADRNGIFNKTYKDGNLIFNVDSQYEISFSSGYLGDSSNIYLNWPNRQLSGGSWRTQGNGVVASKTSVPLSGAASGYSGQFAADANFIYVYTGNGINLHGWVRSAAATW